MPALRVSIDGTSIATVSTDGHDLLDLRIHGTRIDEELAMLDLTGGSFPEPGESTYLIWIHDLAVRAGQVVTISFLESASTSHAGKTIEELFRDEPPQAQSDIKPVADVLAELRAKPKLREKFSFRLDSSTGTAFTGETGPEEHGFAFAVVWQHLHPVRARVLLHSYTLDSLEARGPGKYYINEKIHCGDSIEFELLP